MGLRVYRRSQGIQGNRRKAIGALVVVSVLVAAGLTGVQLASATTTSTAPNVIVVNGQQFNVSGCAQLEINGDKVICDGEQLAPEQDQDDNAAALASAQALEESCDQFAADVQAVEDGQNGEDQQNADEQKTAEEARAERKRLAKKWSAAMDAAEEKQNAQDPNAQDPNAQDPNAQDPNAGDEDAASAAVASAQATLLQACLALADAKEAAGVADDDKEQQGAQMQTSK
jgi:hypothetical protein